MYAAIAALFIAMPQQGMAQEVYGLKIAGVAVTSENCNDLSVIKGVTGNAKYDNESKKLTLDGATIHATSAHGLENRIDGLIIRVTNENAITSDKKVGIWNMDKEGSIAWVWDRIPTFTDCAITSPAGTYWEEIEEYEYPYFYLYDSDRNVLTDWVVISKGASGINSAATDTAAKKHGIYTLDGVRINGKFESLPAGIYIVDGKKTVKK